MIFLTVMSINFIGDGLRDALDPVRAAVTLLLACVNKPLWFGDPLPATRERELARWSDCRTLIQVNDSPTVSVRAQAKNLVPHPPRSDGAVHTQVSS